jgi:predicted MFS family arabinose efflux permease
MLIALHGQRVAESERGRASAVSYLGFDLGIGLGAWVLSPVFQRLGLTGLYLLAAGASVAGSVLARLMMSANGRNPRELVTEAKNHW